MLPGHYSRKNWGGIIRTDVALLLLALFLGLLLWTGYMGVLGISRRQGEWLRSVGMWSLSREFDRSGQWEDVLGAVLDVGELTPAGMLSREMNLRADAQWMPETAPTAESRVTVLLEDDFLWEPDPYEALWPDYPEQPVLLFPDGDPVVLIYHTHNGETYKAGEDGKAGGVVQMGAVMASVLESDHAIKTAHTEAIHDRPDFTKAYNRSMITLRQYLTRYPDLRLAVDFHRDAGFQDREDTLVYIGGEPCAKIMLVVGTGHPDYKENEAFAKKIESKCNEMYPGLMKPVRIAKDRRYNQHLTPNSILIEVGSDLNTVEDAENATRLAAHVLAAVLTAPADAP
jgi:stage II sporulation protein P